MRSPLVAFAVMVCLAGGTSAPAQAGVGFYWSGDFYQYYVTRGGPPRGDYTIWCSDAGYMAKADGDGGNGVTCGHDSRASAQRGAMEACSRRYYGCRASWSAYDDDRTNMGWINVTEMQAYQDY